MNIQSLILLAQMMANQYDIKVVIKGARACTDGKTIYLPAVTHTDDPDAQDLLEGYIDHEIGHHRETDFAWCHENLTDKFAFGLMNAMEDPRQEQLTGAEFPGSDIHLHRIVEVLHRRGNMAAIREDMPPRRAVMFWCNHALRLWWRQDVILADAVKQGRKILVQRHGEQAVGELEGMLKEAMQASNTPQIGRIALRIVDWFDESVEEAKEHEQQQAASGPDNTDPSNEDESQEDASDDQSPGDQDDDDADPSTEQSGDADTEPATEEARDDEADSTTEGQGEDDASEQDSASSAPTESAEDEGDPEASDAVRNTAWTRVDEDVDDLADEVDQGRILESIVKEIVEKALQEEGADLASEAIEVAPPGGTATNGTYARSLVNTFAAARIAPRLAARVRQGLEAETRSRVFYAERGRRMDTRRLPLAATGSRRIFKRRVDGKSLDTALMILLDHSWSMNGKIDTACQSAFVVAKAMESLPSIDVAVTAFPAMEILKRFNQRTANAAPTFQIEADGGTPMSTGMMYAGAQLMGSRRQRKVLLTITDGQPDNATAAQEQSRLLRAQGVQMLGIGIGVMVSDVMFQDTRTIQSVDELADALFGLLRGQLTIQAAA